MTNLLADILIIGKAAAERFEFKPTSLNVTKLCQDLIEQFRLGSGTGYRFEFIGCSSATNVFLDEKLLNQIVINLLSNAVKYSKPGRRIILELNYELGQVVLRMKDKGIGIPAEDLQHLGRVVPSGY